MVPAPLVDRRPGRDCLDPCTSYWKTSGRARAATKESASVSEIARQPVFHPNLQLPRPNSTQEKTPIVMCDSFRPKAGLLMIRGSVFIFVLGDILPKSQIALAGLQKALILISVILSVVGIYFVKSSKRCPICGENSPTFRTRL